MKNKYGMMWGLDVVKPSDTVDCSAICQCEALQ